MATHDGGGRLRALPLNLQLIGVLEYRRRAFEARFGRPPCRGEPLFFDPEAPEPRRLPRPAREAALAEVLELVGQPDHDPAAYVRGA